MARALILTVGTGTGSADITQPLLKVIRDRRPERVVLVASAASRTHAEAVQAAAGLPAEASTIALVDNPDDVQVVFLHALDALRGLAAEGFPPDVIDADYTSGTKAMTSGLSLHRPASEVIARLVQESLDRRRHFVGPLQWESMAGVFDQPDLDVTQQCQQSAGGLGRDQGVGTAEQVQLRSAEGMQGMAGIQGGKHVEPCLQNVRRDARCPQHQLSGQRAGFSRPLAAQQAEALECRTGIGRATGAERRESVFRHRTRPVGSGDEAGIAGQGQQAAAALPAPCRQLGGEHAAQ